MKTRIYSFFQLNEDELAQSIRQQRARKRVTAFFTPDADTIQAFSKPQPSIQPQVETSPASFDLNNDLFEIKDGVLLRYNGKEEHVQIPEGVTQIGEKAFYECSDLASITIPGSVTQIGDYAFTNCHFQTSITIPDSVTQIGEYAFCCCKSLRQLYLPRHLNIPRYLLPESCIITRR